MNYSETLSKRQPEDQIAPIGEQDAAGASIGIEEVKIEMLNKLVEDGVPSGRVTLELDHEEKKIIPKLSFSMPSSDNLKAEMRMREGGEFKSELLNSPFIQEMLKPIMDKVEVFAAKAARIYEENKEIFDFFFSGNNNEEAISFIESLTDADYSLLEMDAETIGAIRQAHGKEKMDTFLDFFTFVDPRLPEFYRAVLSGKNEGPIHIGVENFFTDDFIPMNYGEPTSALMKVSPRKVSFNQFNGVATFKDKDGNIIKSNNIENLLPKFGTRARKLLDAATCYLTEMNYYKSDNINQSVLFSLTDFWESCGHKVTQEIKDTPEEQSKEKKRVVNLKKALRKDLEKDLKLLRTVTWTGAGTGANKGAFADFQIIAGFAIDDDLCLIDFGYCSAMFLIHSYQLPFPTVLFKLDSKNPNSYPIGRKIAMHSSMDSNAEQGTAGTLGVSKLLEWAPEIRSYEDLINSGNRNWKKYIKGSLEKSLNALVEVGYLKRWEYRQRKTKSKIHKLYTLEQANKLTWNEYRNLVVDYELEKMPNQEERRARRLKEKQERLEKEEALNKPKRKRGRPKKTDKK